MRSVSAPFSTWWLRGSRPGGFPPDPILGLCGEGGGGGGRDAVSVCPRLVSPTGTWLRPRLRKLTVLKGTLFFFF